MVHRGQPDRQNWEPWIICSAMKSSIIELVTYLTSFMIAVRGSPSNGDAAAVPCCLLDRTSLTSTGRREFLMLAGFTLAALSAIEHRLDKATILTYRVHPLQLYVSHTTNELVKSACISSEARIVSGLWIEVKGANTATLITTWCIRGYSQYQSNCIVLAVRKLNSACLPIQITFCINFIPFAVCTYISGR